LCGPLLLPTHDCKPWWVVTIDLHPPPAPSLTTSHWHPDPWGIVGDERGPVARVSLPLGPWAQAPHAEHSRYADFLVAVLKDVRELSKHAAVERLSKTVAPGPPRHTSGEGEGEGGGSLSPSHWGSRNRVAYGHRCNGSIR